MVWLVELYFGLIINYNMTINELVEFNKTYSYISCVIEFIKDPECGLIFVKDIKSIDLICGFGDNEPFYNALKEEEWDKLFKDNWEGDGHYNIDIVYKNTPDYDDYRTWFYYDVEDFQWYKYNNDELNFSNNIPFDWDNF